MTALSGIRQPWLGAAELEQRVAQLGRFGVVADRDELGRDADGDFVLLAFELGARERAVLMSGAITDPVSRSVERGQRNQHESALEQARMRQGEALARVLAAIVVDEVEIEGPRPPALPPPAAHSVAPPPSSGWGP